MADRRFRQIAALSGHEAWAALEGHVKDMREAEVQKLARTLIAGGDQLDRQALAYLQGKYAGMKIVLDLPADAAKEAAKESE